LGQGRPVLAPSKAQRIEEILAAMPARSFVLVGDSGERDPEMYAAIRARHPDRIAGIVIVTTAGSDLSSERFAGMDLIDDYDAQDAAIAKFVGPT
jgi:phosphatidate phosphatase APP1